MDNHAPSRKPRRQPREEQHEGSRVRVLRDLLDRDREAEDAGAGAAVFGGDAKTEEAGVAEDLEQILGVFAGVVDLARPRFDLVLRQAADGLLELLHFLRQRKIHRARLDSEP